jgi:hypothetical protein
MRNIRNISKRSLLWYRKMVCSVVRIAGYSSDKKFESLVDRDFNEFENFYFVAQSYLKQAVMDLHNDLVRVSE